MVFSGELSKKPNSEMLRHNYIFVNLTKILEYFDKYQVLLQSSTSKYQVLLNFKRPSTSKFQVLNILHQYKYLT